MTEREPMLRLDLHIDGSGDLYGENRDGTAELLWEMTPEEVCQFRAMPAMRDARVPNPEMDN